MIPKGKPIPLGHLVACVMWGVGVWGSDLAWLWHMVPKGDPLAIGVSLSLLFDVLSEISLSCEAVCFFFLPKPG